MVDYQNQFNSLIFNKDLFSNFQNKYKKISKQSLSSTLLLMNIKTNDKVQIYIPRKKTNMNSEIFLISTREKKFILKKEKISKKEFLIEKKKFDYLKKK